MAGENSAPNLASLEDEGNQSPLKELHGIQCGQSKVQSREEKDLSPEEKEAGAGVCPALGGLTK